MTPRRKELLEEKYVNWAFVPPPHLEEGREQPDLEV